MRIAAVSAAALIFMASPAFAQDVEDPEVTAEAEESEEIVVEGAVEPDNVEVCRQVRVTGTRFRQTVCMTRREQNEQIQNNRDVVNDHRYSGPGAIEYDDGGFPVVPPI